MLKRRRVSAGDNNESKKKKRRVDSKHSIEELKEKLGGTFRSGTIGKDSSKVS